MVPFMQFRYLNKFMANFFSLNGHRWEHKKFIFLMYPRKDIKRIPILPFYSKTRPFMLTCACFSLHVDSKQANSIFIPDKKIEKFVRNKQL